MKKLITSLLFLASPIALANGAQGFYNQCALEQAKKALGSRACTSQSFLLTRLYVSVSGHHCVIRKAQEANQHAMIADILAPDAYDESLMVDFVLGGLQSHLGNQCPDREAQITKNNDNRSLRVEISTKQAEGPAIKEDVLAAIKDVDVEIQHHAMRIVSETCTGEGGSGESPVLTGMPAYDRAKELNITVEEAISLNNFLLNTASDPCNDTLFRPAVDRLLTPHDGEILHQETT
ncbi:MAG: hypothetical protein AAF202_04960 [Pseudomonadota bacterium]